jgi:hypothetical protein
MKSYPTRFIPPSSSRVSIPVLANITAYGILPTNPVAMQTPEVEIMETFHPSYLRMEEKSITESRT